MSKHLWITGLVAAVLVLGTACKSSTTPPDEDSFIGTWHATKAEFVSAADPNTKVDIVAGGSTVTLVLDNTSAVLTITDPGEDPVVYSATWSASSDILTLTWTSGLNGEAQFDYALNGDNLTMEGGHVPFDFTEGDLEEAILNLILVRQ
jgi:hypothetical protein